MKVKNKHNIGCVTQYASCVQWNLGDIPCLGISTGDTLDQITFAIVAKICSIAGDDLSTISVQCLIDKLDATEPVNKTITSYLQLIIDNECKLKDLIDAINTRIDGLTPTLSLDLKCLAVLDGFGNPLPYTVQSVLQQLIDKACLFITEIAGLGADIADLQDQIDNLPSPYTEPLMADTCVYTNKHTSQALALLASDYCTYKGVLGTTSELQQAVGQQCDDLNTEFAADANFIQSPSTIADTVNNLWIVLCKRSQEILALQDCACKVSCKDIIVGFTTTFNDDQTVTLNFTTGAGTSIPSGFIDCGSNLIIKNDMGVSTLSIPVVIAQGGSSVDIDISMFEAGEYLQFSLDAELCNNTLGISCSKCVSKTVRNLSGCCLITNTGDAATTITYKVCTGNS